MNAAPVLIFDRVSVNYRSVEAVSDVSFDVRRGDFFCVVGENGSGKSSLMKCALGIMPPASGMVEWLTPRDKISYVPQICSIEENMPATVLEVVLSGRQFTPGGSLFYTREDRAAALKTLETLEIAPLAATRIGELSGGQTRRVLLARALCREPDVLVLDEPCAGLDESIAVHLNELLADGNRVRGMTVIMVSHDLADVRKNATRVAVMNRSLVFCGSVGEWEARG